MRHTETLELLVSYSEPGEEIPWGRPFGMFTEKVIECRRRKDSPDELSEVDGQLVPRFELIDG